MSPDKGQGTIPLEDMRSRSSGGPAVLRKERKSTKPAETDRDEEDKPKDKSKEKPKGKNNGDNSDNNTEAKELPLPAASDEPELLDFTSEEMTEVIPPDLVPTRRYMTMPLSMLDISPSDDEFDLPRMPGSLYTSIDSFPSMESETFTPRRPSDSAEQRDDERARKQIQALQETIRKLTEEKEVAQRDSARAAEQIEEMKHLLNSDMNEIARDAESLGQEIKKIKEENRLLREELNDAQSHIFSLQPYRKDLTAEEVGRQYDDLVEQVQDWVQKFMDPWLDDYETGIEALATNARKQSGEASRFRRTLQRYPDLVHGSMFPETDEDIIVAIIMRFLHDNIFQKIMYGAGQTYTEMISFIETQMQAAVEPKRDLFAVRSWIAEGYNALLSAPQFKKVRNSRSRDLTMELAGILHIFCKKDRFQWFCQNMEENCIAPAMVLYEKLQVSTHHFYLDINPYITWGPGSRLTFSVEFLDNIEKLDCKNILQNRKAFNMAKIDPRPSRADLYDKLTNVCTVVPALYMRQIGQRDAIKAPAIVRKQQMLVAWGSEEKRDKFVEDGDQSLVSFLYFSKSRKRGESWWLG